MNDENMLGEGREYIGIRVRLMRISNVQRWHRKLFRVCILVIPIKSTNNDDDVAAAPRRTSDVSDDVDAILCHLLQRRH